MDIHTANKYVDENFEKVFTPPEDMVDPVELAAWQLRNYMPQIEALVEKYKSYYNTDFFVLVTAHTDVVKQQPKYVMKPRRTCPTPTTSQTVFHYHHGSGDLEHLWTIPDRYRCKEIEDHYLELDPDLDPIKKFTLAYLDGSLDELAKKLNGEDKLQTGIILRIKEPE